MRKLFIVGVSATGFLMGATALLQGYVARPQSGHRPAPVPTIVRNPGGGSHSRPGGSFQPKGGSFQPKGGSFQPKGSSPGGSHQGGSSNVRSGFLPSKPSGKSPGSGSYSRPGTGTSHPGTGSGTYVRPGTGTGTYTRPGTGSYARPDWSHSRPYASTGSHYSRPVYRQPWRHDGWHHGCYVWPRAVRYWGGWGYSGWWMRSNTLFVYTNPYWYATPGTVVIFDYSRPLPGPPPTLYTPGLGDPVEPPYPDDALARFDAARASFRVGDHVAALGHADQALRLQNEDPALHEFRALVLFSLRRYQEAAGTVHALLARGPGWNWQTMITLYGDPGAYTRQLRDLEAARNANPTRPELRFLLAYHYLTAGHEDAAANQLRDVVRLNPKDELSAALLEGLGRADAPVPLPPVPSAN